MNNDIRLKCVLTIGMFFQLASGDVSLEQLTFTLSPDGTSYAVEPYDYNMEGNLVIPSEYNGLPVTAIGKFAGCINLTGIVIPSTVKEMEYNAFIYCPQIKNIEYLTNNPVYTSGVDFDADVFENAVVNVPFGAIPNFIDMGWGDFIKIKQQYNNKGVKLDIALDKAGTLMSEINLEFIPYITDFTISGPINGSDILVINRMNALEEIDMSNAIVEAGGKYYFQQDNQQFYTQSGEIGRYWFNHSFPKKIKLPQAYQIVDEAFASSRFEEILLPESLQVIGKSAFSMSKSLRGMLITKNVLNIEEGAFYSCKNIERFDVDDENRWYKSIDGVLVTSDMKNLICFPPYRKGVYNVPTGIESLAKYSFYNTSLSKIGVSNSVKEIGESSFGAAYNLTTLILGAGIKSIGAFAFNWSPNIKDFYCMCVNPPATYMGDYLFDSNVYENTLYVPQGSKLEYWLDPIWGRFKNIKDVDGDIAIDVSLDDDKIDLGIGNTYKLSLNIISNEFDDCKVNWYSEDESIAIVDENGMVTGVSKGETAVTQ